MYSSLVPTRGSRRRAQHCEQALTLKNSDEKLLAATMLAVPSELYLFEQLRGFDAHALLDSRDAALALVATQSADLGGAL